MYREPPSHEECIEAMEVMILAYGYRRTLAFLKEAVTNIEKEEA
jgi:hypothetical protein